MRDHAFHLVEELQAGRITRRELVRRAAVLGFSLPAAQALLSACGEAEGGRGGTTGTTARRGGTLVVGTTVPGAEPDPWFAYDSGGVATSQFAGEYLARPGRDNVLEPQLATTWTPGATPKEWIFTIRQGVRFQDGRPLTARDVATSFNRITDPGSKSSALAAFEGVLSTGNAEASGPHEVRFHLDRPFADFPYLVSTYTYSAVILPADYEPGTFVRGRIGTGPYILESYAPKRSATFVRNPTYWRPSLPYLDRLTLRYYAEYPAIVLALQSGEVGLNLETRYQGSQALFDSDDVQVLREPSSAYRAVHLRTDRPPFDDRRVREALALCLDRPGLVKGLYNDLARVGNDHAFAPVYTTAPQDLPQRNQDYDRAKALLSEAGHRDGLRVTITAEQFQDVPAYGVFIKDMCRPAGIDVQLEILTSTAFYGSGDNQPWLTVPSAITHWASRGTASQTIGPAYRCKGVWNAAHWCHPEFERLMSAFDAELDLGRRRELAARAARVQHDEVPSIIAYWIDELRTARKDVQGLTTTPRPDLAVLSVRA